MNTDQSTRQGLDPRHVELLDATRDTPEPGARAARIAEIAADLPEGQRLDAMLFARGFARMVPDEERRNGIAERLRETQHRLVPPGPGPIPQAIRRGPEVRRPLSDLVAVVGPGEQVR
ncbi:hypothetical protein FRAHR75_770023 [Frankia sp. Hr75.2]|nr:hypothetical protein FRAHR75_770023 [Frankia sp. Hr75.2]